MPKAVTPEVIQQVKEMYEQRAATKEIKRITNLSEGKIYHIVADLVSAGEIERHPRFDDLHRQRIRDAHKGKKHDVIGRKKLQKFLDIEFDAADALDAQNARLVLSDPRIQQSVLHQRRIGAAEFALKLAEEFGLNANVSLKD